MRVPLTEQLDRLARKCVPFAITVLFVVAGSIPMPVPGYGDVAPAASLMAVYYWSVYRSDLFPAAAVFAVGVLNDVLSGTPLGLSALVLLGVYALVASQRRYLYDKPFLMHWAGFVFFAAAAGLSKWAIMSFFDGVVLDLRPTLFQLLMTLVLYPCVAWLLMRAHVAFLRQV